MRSDITRNMERCTIVMKPLSTAGGVGRYNETRWYAWSIYLPKEKEFSAGDSYPAVTHWLNHAQIIYNDANRVGKALFHLVPRDNRWQAQVRGGPINKYKTKFFNFGSLKRGVWHDFLMEFHYHGNDGKALTRIQYRAGGGSFVEVVNDKRANVPLTTLPPAQHVYSFDVGIYRDGRQNGDQVIYVDGPWVGKTQADVSPFFK